MLQSLAVLKFLVLLPALSAGTKWFQISPLLTCLKNEDGIKPIAKKQFDKTIGMGLRECKESCEEHAHCKAVDWLDTYSTCLFYAVPCTAPKQEGGSSWAWSDTDSYNPVDSSGGAYDAFESAAPAPGPKGDEMEKYVASGSFEWGTISDTVACSKNLDGIKPTGWKKEVLSLHHCQEQCERRSECGAVDFFQDMSICVFFESACMNPKETAGGAMSMYLKRNAAWEEVDSSVPCYTEHSPKTYPLGLWSNCPDLAACKEACVRKAHCKAVDFHSAIGFCGFLPKQCNVKKLKTNRLEWEKKESQMSADDEDYERVPAGSHHKMTKESGTLTISELKSWAIDKGRRSRGWEDNIKDAISCEEPWLHGKNLGGIVDNGDSPIDKDYKMDKEIVVIERVDGIKSMASCLDLCQRTPGCSAADLSMVRNKCDLRAGPPCVMPSGLFQLGEDSVQLHTVAGVWSAQEKLSMSAHIRWPSLTWQSRPRSCEINKENIKPLDMTGHDSQRKSLAKCKKECEVRPGCSAIDYYKKTQKCLHYAESCINPLGAENIATSHWISRTPLTSQEVEADRKKKLLLKRKEEEADVDIKANTGFSVSSSSKSALGEEAEEDTNEDLAISFR